MPKKDNSTLRSKISLRKKLLKEIDAPIIMETHGGIGVLFNACYRDIKHGVVFEKDPVKVVSLAEQRPTWLVYEADCVRAIAGGVGEHLPINFFDLDPYGSPWEAVATIFDHWKYLPPKFALAIIDGQRQKVRAKGSWMIKQLQAFVSVYGNDQIFVNYKEVCEELFAALAAARGFAIKRWTAYYCGHIKNMTHFGAILERD